MRIGWVFGLGVLLGARGDGTMQDALQVAPATAHTGTNIGSTEMRGLIVELKEPKR